MARSGITGPEFLSVGHLSFDVHLTASGDRSLPVPGGAAAFTALTARNLTPGAVAAVVSAGPGHPFAEEQVSRIERRVVRSSANTVFEDRVIENHRMQRLLDRANRISLVNVPGPWRRPKLLLACPLLNELPLNCRRWFAPEFAGLVPQGWFRAVADDGHIELTAPEVERIAGPWDVIVLSRQEAEAGRDLRPWEELCDVLAVTLGDEGAELRSGGRTIQIAATKAPRVVDPTGAGDVWAAAFSIRYAETGDAEESGRFASAAAAICVGRPGLEGVPQSRAEVEQLL